jgi:hypothetical protein
LPWNRAARFPGGELKKTTILARAFSAWLMAVAVALISFACAETVWALMMTGFMAPAFYFGFWLVIITLLLVPVACAVAFVPLLMSLFAVRLCNRVGWYALCGAVAGLILSPLAVYDLATGSPTMPAGDPDQLPTFWSWFWESFVWRGFATQGPIFALGGAASGIECWFLRPRIAHEHVST